MSHFNTLVISPNNLQDEKELAAILQPYHEWECTGVDDQYVIDIDKTQEVKAAWDKLDPKPDDCLEDWAESYFGYKQVLDPVTREVVAYLDHTNPNKRWDWWQIGGRWHGMLLPKTRLGTKKGSPGLMGSRSEREGVDILQKKNLDADTMRAQSQAAAETDWAAWEGAINGQAFKLWQEVLERHYGGPFPADGTKPMGFTVSDEMREEFHAQGAIKDLQKAKLLPFFDADAELALYRRGKQAWVQRGIDGAFATFSVLKDGAWYERGSMGWWGMVSNEADVDEWNRQVNQLIDDTPDDHWIALVDCHI